MVKRLTFIWLLLSLFSLETYGQKLLSYVTVDNSNPYIGEPVRVKVNVYTTTYFTSGVDVGNIRVENALTVYFRSVSSVKTINGQKYAGVEFYYNIFPTKEGEVTIPELKIEVESPKEGDFVGIKRSLKTKPKVLTVKAVPLGYNPQEWLVANSLYVNETWSKPLTKVKVGDVLLRTIYRSANGTLSEFLPETQWDSVAGISLYPNRGKLDTKKTRTSISATRTESVNYLFEKEGEIVIPAFSYKYMNAGNKKIYQKEVDSIVIMVEPNEDLAMLASIKKSLQEEQIVESEEEAPFLIFGLDPRTFTKYLIIGLCILILIYLITKRLVKYTKRKYLVYKTSEVYAFKMLKQSIQKHDIDAFLKASLSWLQTLKENYNSISEFASDNDFIQLSKAYQKIMESKFKYNKNIDSKDFKMLQVEMIQARKHYFRQLKNVKSIKVKNNTWLNPITTINLSNPKKNFE